MVEKGKSFVSVIYCEQKEQHEQGFFWWNNRGKVNKI
jgi:hypothetical protein